MGVLPHYPIPEELKKVLDNQLNGKISSEARVYTKVLKLWKQAKCIDLTKNHYLQLLKMALYIEERQCEIDMQKYDLRNKKISQTDAKIFCIDTTEEWLDEDEKPKIKLEDVIHIIDTTNDNCYRLHIVNVYDKSIEARGVEFLEVYSEEKLYDIKFIYNNYPMRCRHYALYLADQRNVLSYVFPKKQNRPTHSNYSNLRLYNRTIQRNSEQAQAILKILHKSSYPYPYILYGPPGTGKTATIVESICQIVLGQNGKNHVLVCTPSNTAADEITKRILSYIKRNELIYRVYSKSKDPRTIDEKLKLCSNVRYYKDPKTGERGEILNVNYDVIMQKRIVVTSLCTCTRLILMGLRSDHFSHVIIDEAGQSVEPDILIPVSLVSDREKIHSQIVLAGDPKQLGPTVMSKVADIVLGRSILERLMSYRIYREMPNGTYDSKYIIKLLDSYRSHPDIIKIPNDLFYNNELISRCEPSHCQFPVIFHGVYGREEKYPKSISSFNRREIDKVLELIKEIMNRQEYGSFHRNSQEDIGVVTPFKLQSKEIKKELLKLNLEKISVGTVELFQGQEKKYIIVSTVRTEIFRKGEDEHIGFLSNPKRFNVSVTRAICKLIVVGNPEVLQIDSCWKYLLKYCKDNESYHGENFEVDPMYDDVRTNYFDKSEIVVSSNLFKWDKFKIFMLGGTFAKKY